LRFDPQLPGFDRLFSFNWPSVAYALDILAWDYCFGLALLLAAPVFTGGPAESAVRTGMMLAGILCLAGLLGVLTANMQISNVGIAGYGVAFPVVTLLMARVFTRERSWTATEDRRSCAEHSLANRRQRPPSRLGCGSLAGSDEGSAPPPSQSARPRSAG
jgi:hypothetical protein